MDERRQWVIRFTEELRNSAAGGWRAVREKLIREGIKANDAAVVDFGPDGGGHGAGLLVSRDRKVFYFTIPVDSRGVAGEGGIFAWDVLNPNEPEGIFKDGFAIGLEVLGEQ